MAGVRRPGQGGTILMRMSWPGLSLALVASPALAQEVAGCDPAPPVAELVEPWEETSVALAGGAVRLALLHAEAEEGMRLLVLTLPPVEAGEEAEPSEGPPPMPERRCRIVAEGGLGFAVLDVAGAEVAEDPEAGTLTARLPALRFVPESTELEELVLVLTFGAADDSLAAELEEAAGEEAAPDAEPGAEEGP